MWLPLVCPPLETWPTIQACALIGNRFGDPLVHRPEINPLSHTSQDRKPLFKTSEQIGKYGDGLECCHLIITYRYVNKFWPLEGQLCPVRIFTCVFIFKFLLIFLISKCPICLFFFEIVVKLLIVT